MSTPERRRYPRLPFAGTGRLRIGNGKEVSTQLMNISPFGASLIFQTALDVGTPIELAFQLELDQDSTPLMIHGEVQDSWRDDDAGKTCVRVRFVDPPLQTIESIRKFMQVLHFSEDVENLGSSN